jgi:pilus assembly protein CpaE
VILATVSNDAAFQSDIRNSLESRCRFDSIWGLGYDESARLLALKSDQKSLVFLDFSDRDLALPPARVLTSRSHIALVGVNCGESREELLQLMQVGIRDALPQLTAHAIQQAANRAMSLLDVDGQILGDVFAFIPAKPGCGATTIATYATAMAAAYAEEPTLLLDYDIRQGITTFLLKGDGARSIVDALERARCLDRDIWAGLVSPMGHLHLLGSGAIDYARSFPAEDFANLLDFAVRQYSSIAVDLPGSMEDFECEVLLRAKRIMLVCTPDIGALHVARRKSKWLSDLQLADKSCVVLNGVDRRSTLSVSEVERIIQLPVRHTLPAGAKEITAAAQRGAILDSETPLGRQVASLAREMAPAKSGSRKSNPVRRFIEYFSVSPAREGRIA